MCLVVFVFDGGCLVYFVVYLRGCGGVGCGYFVGWNCFWHGVLSVVLVSIVMAVFDVIGGVLIGLLGCVLVAGWWVVFMWWCVPLVVWFLKSGLVGF